MGEIGMEIGAYQDAVQRFDELAARQMGLHLTDLRILSLLSDSGSLPAGRVAKGTGLSPAATTAAIDRLEKTGHVRRVRTETDRRSVLVELTPQARAQIERIWGPLVGEGMAKLGEYSIAELTMLRDFIRWVRELQLRHNNRVAKMPARHR